MSFTLRKSLIDAGLYEILESGQLVKEIAIPFKIYKWPSAFSSIEEILRFISSEEKRGAKRAAYRLVAAKQQSAFELQQKLERKGFSQNCLNALIEEFKQLGYLSDGDLTQSIIEKEIRRGYGPRYIEAKLRSLGLATDQVRKIVTDKLQQGAIAKLKKRWPKPAAALQRRGFDLDIIFRELKNFVNEE
jgi:SOS response regulatory protein OraA/RecX